MTRTGASGRSRGVRVRTVWTLLAVLALVAGACSSGTGAGDTEVAQEAEAEPAAQQREQAQPSDRADDESEHADDESEHADEPLVIELRDIAYQPTEITLAPGEPVQVTLRNLGEAEHEWMVGREVLDGGGYHDDLLAASEVEVVDGHGYEIMGLGSEDQEKGHGDDHVDDDAHAAGVPGSEVAAPLVHADAGHDGGMVVVDPGGEVTLELVLPSDAAGEWEMGCFIPGHYEAGMRGTVTVEA